MNLIKQCSCGTMYPLLDFLALPAATSFGKFPEGIQAVEDELYKYLMYRNCPCGSTITTPLDSNKDFYQEEK